MVDAPQEPAQSMGLGLPDPMHGGGSIFHPSIEDALLGASFPDAGGAPGIDFSAQDLNDANFQTRIPSASLSSPELFNDFSLFMSDYDLPSISALSGQSQPPLGLDRVPSLNVNASTPASESSGDCRAKCYTLLLQQLLFPRQSLPESTRPSIDVILQAGRRLRQVLDRILGCSVCVSNRSSILLLAVVMERVVQMLDWIIEEKTVLHAENARSRRRALNSWMQNPSSPDVQDGKKNVCRIPLLVGDTAVDEDTKQSFLKQLILTRMKMLAAKLQDVRVKTTTRPGDCIYRAAELMLAESLQRLDYLRGQVQIWEESC